ncbi:eaa protein [Salmonella enterica]|uniref:hypothetical protein n=1 Tax=Salmonella enterica TaxID=28901 RepID=UPI00098D69F8|nr:hypothetical protein [Salmonella enterica]EBU8484947.1 eaa protein [Salmonella enterica subsp. enterica serovar Newport]ECF6812823.1 eaa protein [Salmonella enterica subsp. enterica]ECJ3008316.1 eaa protein [Salmonella enterica subsp. enterica serovar Thompson]EDI3440421.1 eaa protein [Salmonella enterica subsp. enterica serovar Bareilly]EAQ4533054.1 eaa protein [Salmonella enterica]
MTTITKERIELFIKNPLENGLTRGEQMELARIALASLTAEPVSQTYELPQTQFEQVADLYEMQFDDGRTCVFHTDGAKAAQWLLACDGNKVQEYVRIERYQEAVIGNSPVIPEGYALVPIEATEEMLQASYRESSVYSPSAYRAMIAAAPQQEEK